MGELDVLVSEQAIHRVLNRYAQLLDSFQFEAIERLFTDSVHIDFPGYEKVGGEGFGKAMRSACSFVAAMQHLSTNVDITLQDPDNAFSHSNCIAVVVKRDNGSILIESGRYDHRFIRDSGSWRISEIRFSVVFTRELGADEATS